MVVPVPPAWSLHTGPRWSIANVRSAAWAWRALRLARRDLATIGSQTQVSGPPALPASAVRGVKAILRRTKPTCLERAVVMQRWLAAHGADHDIMVGVSRRDDRVIAHAWLDFEQPVSDGSVFEVLAQYPKRGPG